MAFKFLLIASLAIAASAVQVQHQNYGQYQLQQVAPVATKVLAPSAPVLVKKYQEEPTAPAHYSFEYSVDDGHTGDVKSQKEVRDGDRVEGYYSLIDADGHKRVVHYTADEHNGFQARVEREEIKGYVAPAPVKVQYATPAPLKVQYAAPSVQYSAPSVQYSAPSVQYAAPTVQYATPSPVKYVAPAPLKYVAPTTAKFVQKVESYTPIVKKVQTFAPLAKVAVPTKLQYASPLPQYTQPQVQYSQPQVQYSQPQVQYSQPQVQYSHQPQVQYSQPKSQYQSSGVTSVKFESPVANYYY